jgi:hypothetical protein
MANSEDFIQRLILDDSDFLKGMQTSTQAAQTLEKEFESATKTIKVENDKMAQAVVQGADKIQKANKDTVTAVNSTNAAMKRNQQEVTEVAMAIAKVGGSGDKLTALFKKLEAVKLTGVAADISNIEKEFVDLISTIKLTDGQMETLVNNIEEIAQTVATLQGDEFTQMANNAEKVTKEFTSAKAELKALKNQILSGSLGEAELKEATARAAELTDQIGDANEKIKNLASDTRGIDTLIEGTRLVTAGFAIAEGAAALFGDENKEVQEALVKLNAIMVIQNSLQEAHALLLQNSSISMKLASIQQGVYATVVGGSTGALKLFRIALALTGVGLLVIALGALIANFDKVKEGITKLFPSLGNLGEKFKMLKDTFYGVLDGIVAGFGVIGDVISKAFDGDFSGAIASAKTLGTVIGEAVVEGTKEATKDRLNKEMADEIDKVVVNQKRRVQLLEAGGKETSKLQKTILDNELKSLKLAGAAKEDIEQKEFEIQLFNAEQQKKISDKAIKDREDALNKFKQIQKELTELSKEGLNEEQLFNFNKDASLKALEELRKGLIKAGKDLGKDVSEGLKVIDERIEGISSRDFTSTLKPVEKLKIDARLAGDEIRKLELKLQDLKNAEINFGVDNKGLQQQVQDQIEKLGSEGLKSDTPLKIEFPKIEVSSPTPPEFESDFDIFLGDVENFGDLYKKVMSDIFGEDSEIAMDAVNSAGIFLNEFGKILNEATQLQLDAIDKQIDAVSERREKLESDLEYELELQSEGLANNVDSKQAEVDGLLAEEARLTAEREKIQKEAQRRQIIADTAIQAQSLITASIQIIKGFANIPIVGLPLGIAAVASLLGFFAKTKADALKATKLSGGAEKISDYFGFGQRHGETDLEGRGDGYRLVDQRTGKPTNVIISGREMLLPESISLPNEQFFQSLKTGIYNGIDLNEAVGFYKTFKMQGTKSGNTSVSTTNVINQIKAQKQRQYVVYTDKKGIQKGILVSIDDNMADGSEIILN